MYPVCQFAYFSAGPMIQVAVGRAASSASLPGFERKCFVSPFSQVVSCGYFEEECEERGIFCFALFFFSITNNKP